MIMKPLTWMLFDVLRQESMVAAFSILEEFIHTRCIILWIFGSSILILHEASEFLNYLEYHWRGLQI